MVPPADIRYLYAFQRGPVMDDGVMTRAKGPVMSLQTAPLKIVVLGDSFATAYGLPPRTRAFPQRLREIFGEAARVTSLARQGKMIDGTHASLDAIISLRPHVVIVTHGGYEGIFKHTFPLKQLATDLVVTHPSNPRGLLRSLKQGLFSVLSAILMSSHGDGAARVLGLRPKMSAAIFSTLFLDVVTQILQQTGAKIIVLLPYPLHVNQFPFSRRTIAANMSFLRGLEDGDRVVTLDGETEFRLSLENFVSDRCHLSEKGHLEVALRLEEQIRRLSLTSVRERAVR